MSDWKRQEAPPTRQENGLGKKEQKRERAEDVWGAASSLE